MNIENNKQLARRWLDLVSAHDIEALCNLTAPTWIMRGGPPNLPAGHAGLRELFRAIGPVEQTWAVEDVIAEGDKVVVRATNICVQDSFFGIDGRGKRQVFSATFTHRIAGGLIQETWRNADDLGRLFQLGARVVPSEPAPKAAANEYVTMVEVLELTRPFEEFAAAVEACARRLETEGIQELVSIQFYATPGSTEVGALLTFADRERVVEHLDMIRRWDEFERFFGTITPRDVRIYGRLSAQAEAWVRQFDVISKTFDRHVTGFVR